jgi:hypothetical protein
VRLSLENENRKSGNIDKSKTQENMDKEPRSQEAKNSDTVTAATTQED